MTLSWKFNERITTQIIEYHRLGKLCGKRPPITSDEVTIVRFVIFVCQFSMAMHLAVKHLPDILSRHYASDDV